MRRQKTSIPQIKPLAPSTMRRIAAGAAEFFPSASLMPTMDPALVNHMAGPIAVHGADHPSSGFVLIDAIDVAEFARWGQGSVVFDSPPCAAFTGREQLRRLRDRRPS